MHVPWGSRELTLTGDTVRQGKGCGRSSPVMWYQLTALQPSLWNAHILQAKQGDFLGSPWAIISSSHLKAPLVATAGLMAIVRGSGDGLEAEAARAQQGLECPQ